MIILFSLFAVIIYSTYTFIGYSEKIKETAYYYPVGISLMVLAHILWLTLAKKTNDSTVLYHYGLVWDIASTISCYLIPILFYGVKLNLTSIVGFLLVLVGLKLISV
jgi:hypothetical protein